MTSEPAALRGEADPFPHDIIVQVCEVHPNGLTQEPRHHPVKVLRMVVDGARHVLPDERVEARPAAEAEHVEVRLEVDRRDL